MNHPLRFALLATVLTVFSTMLAFAQGLTRLGEFKVNEHTAGNQHSSSIAADVEGNFVIVWSGIGEDDSDGGVFMRRFNADGSPQALPVRVNSTIAGVQNTPAVAMNGSGQFVIVWEGPGTSGQAQRIYGQRFGSDGQPVGVNFRADTGADHLDQLYPSVGIDAAGGFAVAYETRNAAVTTIDVYLQFFGWDGNSIGIQRNIGTSGNAESLPSIAMAPSGSFVVSYRTYTNALTFPAISLRRYSAQTGIFSDEEPVAAATSPNSTSNVAIRDDASFVVTWDKSDGDGSGIYARRYSPGGTPGPEIAINTTTIGNQLYPSATFDTRDRFTIVWTSPGATGTDVFGRRYKSDGNPEGEPFQVNTYTTGDQQTNYQPNVAADPAGNFVVTWRSDGQDGNAGGIYADKFFLPATAQVEFRVNTTTPGDQREVSVAGAANGDFAMVWLDESGAAPSIRRQQYTANGLRSGTEQEVASSAVAGAQAMNASGQSVVVWQTSGATPDIFARRYTAVGISLDDTPIPVATQAGQQVGPAVAMYPDGRFVIVWTGSANGDDIFGQVFGSDGVPLPGQSFQSNENVSGNQDDPDVAVLPDGGFVVAWGNSAGANIPYFPAGRIFNVSGGNVIPRTNEFAIASDAPTSVRHPVSVAVDGNGRITFVWESENEGNGGEIFGRRFSANAVNMLPAEMGAVFTVNSTTTGTQKRPSVDALANGDLIVTWCSDQQAGVGNGFDVFVKRFRPGASLADPLNVLENERRVNSFVAGEQGFLSSVASGLRGRKKVAFDALGNYVIGWHSQQQDGSGYGVYASKRILSNPPAVETLAATDIAGNSATLNASISPNGQPVTLAFEYDTQASFLTANVVQAGSFPGDISTQTAQVRLTGLSKNQQYFFRAKATVGTQVILDDALPFTTANAAPQANDDTIFVPGTQVTFQPQLNDTDLDQASATLKLAAPAMVIVDAVSVGTLTLGSSDTTLTFNANAVFVDIATFKYQARDADGVLSNEATVTLKRFATVGGTYQGLVFGENGETGTLRLMLNRTAGAFTGSFFWQGVNYPLDSAFPPTGMLRFAFSAGPNRIFELRLQIFADGTITGVVFENSVEIASVELDRIDDGDSQPDDFDPSGQYTTFLDLPEESATPLAAIRGAPEQPLPAGSGFLVLTIGSKKSKFPLRLAGELPDRTKLMAGDLGLSKRRYLLNLPLYKRGKKKFLGEVVGRPEFPENIDDQLITDLSWTKRAEPSETGTNVGGSELFDAGFANLRLLLRAKPFSATRNPITFAFERFPGQTNALITFSKGGVNPEMRRSLSVSDRQAVRVRPMPNEVDVKLKLKLKPKSPLFSGSFDHPNSAVGRAKFLGVFVQDANVEGDDVNPDVGRGVFIGRDDFGTGTQQGATGKVLIEKVP